MKPGLLPALIALLVTTLFVALGYWQWSGKRSRSMSALYGVECASCHGAELEGRPGWRVSSFHSRSAAPPLNGTGYTPQMPDLALLRVMKRGAVHGVGHVGQIEESSLTDSEARALLAWIKKHWPDNERRYNVWLNKMLSERDD